MTNRTLCNVLLVVGLVVSVFAGVSSSALADDDFTPGAVTVSNGKIAFTGDGPLKYDVWLMDPDGSDPTRLRTVDRLERWPSWSPTGTTIAHEASIPMSLMYGWLGVMDETGNALDELWGGEMIMSRPAWSPDGGSIVISWGFGATARRVIKIPLDGTAATTLVDHDSLAGSWSPDGSRIALSSKAFGLSTWQIVLVDPDGSNPSILTPGGVSGLVSSYAPAWSPDGTKIAFGGVGLATIEDIWIMNADGSSKTLLAANGRNPEWSPDGTMILFERDGAPYIVPAGGGAATILPNWTLPAGLTSAGQFDWQPVFMAKPEDTFVDDDDSVFEADIEWMAAEGITKGCNPPTNDMFCPDAKVTRGQMAAFLVRALGLTDRLDDPFVDDDHSIFEADIERLAAAGITKGCNPPTNNRFCPDGRVTREQMAALLVRALGYTDNGGGDLFTDDDDSIFEGDVDRLGTAGVTRGCNPPTNDRFCPEGLVTRGQMAAFLHRALG